MDHPVMLRGFRSCLLMVMNEVNSFGVVKEFRISAPLGLKLNFRTKHLLHRMHQENPPTKDERPNNAKTYLSD